MTKTFKSKTKMKSLMIWQWFLKKRTWTLFF